MKNFFKKIGRGLRNLGKGIKKAFNSKIGRVIGTIALAIAMPYIFNAFAGAGGGTVGAIPPPVTEAGAAVGTSGGAGAAGAAETVSTAVRAGTRANQIASYSDAVNVGKNLQNDNAVNNATASVQEVVKNSTSVTNTVNSTLENASTIIDKESIIQNNFNTALESNNIPLNAFEGKEDLLAKTYGENAYTAKDFYTLDQKGTLGRKLSADKLARSQYEYLFQSGTGDAASMQLVDGKITGLAGDTNAFADALSLKPSSLKASTQHPSVGAAWSAGKGPVEKMANVGKHFLDMDIAQATGYEGALSGSSVVGTGIQGASLLSRMQPEEEISFGSSNYGAQIQAGAQAETAQAITMAPPLEPMSMQEELMTAANPAQLMSSIRSQAGYSQLYGSLYNFGTANV